METFLAHVMLQPHPAKPPNAIGSVSCSVSWAGPGNWSLGFIVAEPPEALLLPPAAPPRRADGLWQRTCFELFLRHADGAAYREFNFSPSGEWAAYSFTDYRHGMSELDVAPPRIVTSDPAQFAQWHNAALADLGIDPEMLPPEMRALGPVRQYALNAGLEDMAHDEPGPWLAGISAVVEEADGTKSYWALAHPDGPPDFHDPACFVLSLPAVG